MKIFDVVIVVDSKLTVLRIKWINNTLSLLYKEIWDKYIGSHIKGIFDRETFDAEDGELVWENDTFDYTKVNSGREQHIFIRQSSVREYLFEKALDIIDEGIQIYDKNACAIFFNKGSRSISNIPTSADIDGRHLLDIYNLDEDVSTTITALKTGKPVINRVDHYNSSDGTFIATANTAYPIRKSGRIVGTVVFEQTKDIVDIYTRRMESIDLALETYNSSDNKMIHFIGGTFDNILGSGEAIEKSISLAKKISVQDCSVLLVGETGTGKELFAQSIHKASNRRDKKFLAINCAAVPSTLIESLLFGTSKGSFTGSEDNAGYFEEVDGGTLFLDELNSMSLNMQSKILRVLQEKTFRRVGGKNDIKVNVRIISSCNEDPFKAIEENRLRKDLFYRVSTVMIDLPPLRDHIEDIETLIDARIKNNNFHFVNKIESVNPNVIDYLKKYSWPGNVRELFHVVDYALNVADGSSIEMEHLPKYLYDRMPRNTVGNFDSHISDINFKDDNLQSLMDSYEEQVLKAALNHYGDNITKTAQSLGIKRQSLQYRIRKYGIII